MLTLDETSVGCYSVSVAKAFPHLTVAHLGEQLSDHILNSL